MAMRKYSYDCVVVPIYGVEYFINGKVQNYVPPSMRVIIHDLERMHFGVDHAVAKHPGGLDGSLCSRHWQ